MWRGGDWGGVVRSSGGGFESWRWGLGFRIEYLGMSFAGFAERVRVDVGCAHQDAGVGMLGGFHVIEEGCGTHVASRDG